MREHTVFNHIITSIQLLLSPGCKTISGHRVHTATRFTPGTQCASWTIRTLVHSRDGKLFLPGIMHASSTRDRTSCRISPGGRLSRVYYISLPLHLFSGGNVVRFLAHVPVHTFKKKIKTDWGRKMGQRIELWKSSSFFFFSLALSLYCLVSDDWIF